MYIPGSACLSVSTAVLDTGHKSHDTAGGTGARFQADLGAAGCRVMYLQLLYRVLGWPADQTTLLR